jgi:hypothetical protein
LRRHRDNRRDRDAALPKLGAVTGRQGPHSTRLVNSICRPTSYLTLTTTHNCAVTAQLFRRGATAASTALQRSHIHCISSCQPPAATTSKKSEFRIQQEAHSVPIRFRRCTSKEGRSKNCLPSLSRCVRCMRGRERCTRSARHHHRSP